MLGAGAETLNALAQGTHPWAGRLQKAKNAMIALGQGALSRPDGTHVLAAARNLAESSGLCRDDWNGFNVLHRASARVGGLDLGFVPGPGGRDLDGIVAGCKSGEVELLYLLGADEIGTDNLGGAFVVYQGHHGDRGAQRADVVLPGAAYTEKDGTYVNTEGRVQLARAAVFPPGEAREDWKILRALSSAIDHLLPFDTLGELRQRMWQAHPVLGTADRITRAAWEPFGEAGPVDPAPFTYPIKGFYETDPISRASPTMARCSEIYLAGRRPAPVQASVHG
jgi:NADH-quinone oxidoreductase subunit G